MSHGLLARFPTLKPEHRDAHPPPVQVPDTVQSVLTLLVVGGSHCKQSMLQLPYVVTQTIGVPHGPQLRLAPPVVQTASS